MRSLLRRLLSILVKSEMRGRKNHSTQDSHVVPHRATNWAIIDLASQSGRDGAFFDFYGRGYKAEPN